MTKRLTKLAWLENFVGSLQNTPYLRKIPERSLRNIWHYKVLGFKKVGPDSIGLGGTPNVPEQNGQVERDKEQGGDGVKVVISPDRRLDYIRTIERGV